MLRTDHLKRFGALVTALATLISLPAYAKPAGAQLGVVSASGSLTSGGTLSYQFNLNVMTTPGNLVVKASLTGKRLRKEFPVLTVSNPALGYTADMAGTAIRIPARFSGNAVLHVRAKYKGKLIGKQTIAVSIAAPPVTTNLYDVGFENPVTLDGSIVPTSGLGSSLTYTWVQTSGKTVTLSTNGVPQTSFTTDALTNFVTMTGSSSSLYYSYVQSGVTNQLYVEPEHRFGSDSGIALDNQQAGVATYGFKLLVSDGSVTRTGVFNVACTIQTPAQPNIPVGVTAFYKGKTNSTSWSLTSKPTGSSATLIHTNGLIPELRPDVEGIYVIKDNVTGQTLTNTAASWTGVEFCAICHGPNNNVGQDDLVTPWSQTEHATMAQRGVDGEVSSHYDESCFQCHTVGFNQSPAAAINGNFYAVQQQLGWQFPAVLQPGNYAAMPAELKNLANIQCENCHGPGSRHPGAPSISLDVKVCASCHQSGTQEVIVQQWEISPHSGAYESDASHGARFGCSQCHSPEGFTQVAQGVSAGLNALGTNAVSVQAGPLSCQVCHDPHHAFGDTTGNRHQLRVYDTVHLGNPLLATSPTITIGLGDVLTTADLRLTNSTITVTNAGLSAACMVCHNAREWPTQIAVGTNQMYYVTTIPDMSTAGEIFAGLGAYDYGLAMGNSFHTHLAQCQSCHMYTLRKPVNGVPQDSLVIDGVVTPVTTAVYNQFVNVLGNHTFEMSYEYTDTNGVQHTVDDIAACNQCHGSFEPVDSFDFMPGNAQDYDGNGVIEGVQTETQGVLSNLATLMYATGLSNTVSHGSTTYFGSGYSTNNAVLADAQHKAAWNWNLEYYEGSHGVHNTQFTIRMLQSTYTDLSTNYYGDVTKTYQNAFPDAYLR